jgi:agmatinase
MNYDGQAYNFLGLDREESGYKKSRFVIMPVPYEQTTTYRKGACNGPQAIISASREVELFDDELKAEPYLEGIHTLDDLGVTAEGPEKMVEKIHDAVGAIIDDEKTICMLGGEHSISTGLARAYKDKYHDLSVLQLDAHADLRESYQGNRFSHACVMKRIRDFIKQTVGIGIRNMSKEEFDLIQEDKIPIISAADMHESSAWMTKALDHLSDDIYLTIDLDFFDPSIMPAVGTPEPGGGLWYPTLEFLRKLAVSKSIVGFDVVELAPLPVNNVSEFTAAKLIYKLIGYITRFRH